MTSDVPAPTTPTSARAPRWFWLIAFLPPFWSAPGRAAADTKTYFRHSGYPKGARTTTFRQAMEKDPAWVIENAVKGMLPHNRLGRQILKKLKVYSGSEHPHDAQQPKDLQF